ncbi:inositol monophosphatase family protein [Actinacidiphila glaucinigra]|uniref:inositol monophosphatase family protein n=1 Tax=Actinacidiphila glaucinigra TaxID=235986 RepID=UPI002DD9C151|nr:inositol monophosphatase family protein [Actinacidiphila glaucinigra]WSD59374.1 inositol monophosphatase [Actinacidiphila glaucinigra]
MIDDALFKAVEDTVRAAAEAEVVPRWRQLSAADISHKTGPGDLVTVADREAELRLAQELPALLPGSVVVGEEAVHADPGILRRIGGDDPVWIVDPVDGTANFVAGRPEFATLVALARGGEVHASWTYVPRLALMATARRGGGARLNGEPIRTAPDSGGAALKVATSQFAFLDEQERRRFEGLGTDGVEARQCTCAGLDYLEVARGAIDAVAFTWESPWDHAAGVLLVAEAGGASVTAGGVPFRIGGGNAFPFSVARDEATARRVVDLMAGDR